MSFATRNAFRPNLESLDGRVLPSANPLSMPTGLATGALVGAAATKPAAVAVKAGPVFDQMYTVSVLTIQNKTSGTVHFQLKWQGKGWQNYTLKPGETRLYWIEGKNLTAQIRYDWAFKAGYQEQAYLLKAKNFQAGGFAGLQPRKTTDGAQFYFTTNTARTGLSFYRV